jgi:hypothetical protein
MNDKYQNYFSELYNGKILHQTEKLRTHGYSPINTEKNIEQFTDNSLNDEKCPSTHPYRTKIYDHKSDNFMYCYDKSHCTKPGSSKNSCKWTADHKALPDKKEWVPMTNKYDNANNYTVVETKTDYNPPDNSPIKKMGGSYGTFSQQQRKTFSGLTLEQCGEKSMLPNNGSGSGRLGKFEWKPPDGDNTNCVVDDSWDIGSQMTLADAKDYHGVDGLASYCMMGKDAATQRTKYGSTTVGCYGVEEAGKSWSFKYERYCPPPANASRTTGCNWVCNENYYKNGDQCHPHTVCKKDQIITQEGTPTSNRVCYTCEGETYKNGNECSPYTVCADDEIVDKEPTNVSDRTCKQCSNNTYKKNDKCEPCTECHNLEGNKDTDIECTTTSDSVCKNCEKSDSAEFDNSKGCNWTCNAGYKRNSSAASDVQDSVNQVMAYNERERFSNTNMDSCDVISKTCENGIVTPIINRTENGPHCTQTGCNEGYYYLNGKCIECTQCAGPTEESIACTSLQNRTCSPCDKPEHSSFTSGCEWSCDTNFLNLDGKCVDNYGYGCEDNNQCSSGLCKGGFCCDREGNANNELCGKCNNKDSSYPGHCNKCINHGSDNIWNKDRQPSPVEGKGNWDCVAKPSKTTTSSGKTCLPWKTGQGGRQSWFGKNDSDNRCGDPDGSGFDWCYINPENGSNYWESCYGSSNK